MPLQATSGAASYDAFGGGVPAVPQYIEEVFSTTLYTGNGSTQTITNGIDLSTKGGLVWGKVRSTTGTHELTDTVRGANNALNSNNTDAQSSSDVTAFTSSGYTLGYVSGNENFNGRTFVSWTFRKQPKFFDCGTFTAGESTNRRISHALGSAPAFIIIKNTSQVGAWYCYHRSLGRSSYLELQSTNAQDTGISNVWGTSDPTSTDFGVKETAFFASGDTVVYYVFAHDAGGFGLTGTDNVISCGSFNYNTDPQTVTLGYEPQWLMVKQTDGVGDWIMFDNMRGFTANSGGGIGRRLLANTSGAETTNDGLYYGGATGFSLNLPAYGNYIYIAIRRGPMKVPTSGTSVFTPITFAGTGVANQQGSLAGDMYTFGFKDAVDGINRSTIDRLRGGGTYLLTHSTNAETTAAGQAQFYKAQNGVQFTTYFNGVGNNMYMHEFKRAPSFFDVVCYTGTSAVRTINHNLGVVPELMIVKCRSAVGFWVVYSQAIGNTDYLYLDGTSPTASFLGYWNNTTPTASVFTLGTGNGDDTNETAQTYVAYLFATCAGVSKVGSYTGNGTTQTIDCGFTSGARFVMIKATSTTGNWIVADSARGIVAGNDPALYLNSTAAEVTGLDWIDADNSGFVVNETATIAANTNGVSYIFFAVA